MGSSCSERLFFTARGSGSRTWTGSLRTLAWTFSSRKTRPPTANCAWRELSVRFRESLMQRRNGRPVEESVLTLDNLHGQTTHQFKAHIKKESKSRGFTLAGVQTRCNSSVQVFGHSSRSRLASPLTCGWGTGIIWKDERATP